MHIIDRPVTKTNAQVQRQAVDIVSIIAKRPRAPSGATVAHKNPHIQAERTRIKTIIAAGGNSKQAQFLAYDTAMDTDQALRILSFSK
jgi:hypothetical protein